MLERIYSSSKRQPFLRDCQKVSSKQYELQPNNTFRYHLSKYPKQDIIKCTMQNTYYSEIIRKYIQNQQSIKIMTQKRDKLKIY